MARGSGPTFVPNRAGLKEYLRSGELYPALEQKARPIEARAKAGARVESAQSAADHGRTPGKFRDSIHLERHRSPTRTIVRVVADCEGAYVIEARDRTLGTAAG